MINSRIRTGSACEDGPSKDGEGELATKVDQGGQVDQLMEILQSDVDSRVSHNEINGTGISVANNSGVIIEIFKSLSEVQGDQLEDVLLAEGLIGPGGKVVTGRSPL